MPSIEIKVGKKEYHLQYHTNGFASNCGYQIIGSFAYQYKNKNKINSRIRKHISHLIFKEMLKKHRTQRIVVSDIWRDKYEDKKVFDALQYSTIHFIKDNNIPVTNPVIGNHTNSRDMYYTIMGWIDVMETKNSLKDSKAFTRWVKRNNVTINLKLYS